MSTKTELTNTAYDILKVLGKDAGFLYDTIETYIGYSFPNGWSGLDINKFH